MERSEPSATVPVACFGTAVSMRARDVTVKPRSAQVSRHNRQPCVEPRIVFVHIPKTGGTSLDWALRSAYARAGYPKGKSIIRLHAESSSRAAALAGMATRQYRQCVLLYLLGLKHSRYIGGHFGFTEAAHRAYREDWRFITLLRNPVDRWFSAYFYRRYKSNPRGRIHMDLESFADSELGRQSGRALMMNLTDRFSDESSRLPPSPEEAIANLEKFDLVGCLENVDFLIRDLEQLLGVRLELPREKVTPISKEERDRLMTERIRDRAHELCRDDLIVYEHAVRKHIVNRADKPKS